MGTWVLMLMVQKGLMVADARVLAAEEGWRLGLGSKEKTLYHVEKDRNRPHHECSGACRIYIDRGVDYMSCIQITYHIYI
jgi:hypothetical protein